MLASASTVNLKGFGLAAEQDSKNFNPILAIQDLPVQLAEGVAREWVWRSDSSTLHRG